MINCNYFRWAKTLLLRRHTTVAAAMLMTAFGWPSFADTQLIHAGTLLAVPGQEPLQNQTVIIKDGKIVSVQDGFVALSDIAAEASLIDLSSNFVMPGLMDMHVHLQGELGPENDSEQLKMSSADAVSYTHLTLPTIYSV